MSGAVVTFEVTLRRKEVADDQDLRTTVVGRLTTQCNATFGILPVIVQLRPDGYEIHRCTKRVRYSAVSTIQYFRCCDRRSSDVQLRHLSHDFPLRFNDVRGIVAQRLSNLGAVGGVGNCGVAGASRGPSEVYYTAFSAAYGFWVGLHVASICWA